MKSSDTLPPVSRETAAPSWTSARPSSAAAASQWLTPWSKPATPPPLPASISSLAARSVKTKDNFVTSFFLKVPRKRTDTGNCSIFEYRLFFDKIPPTLLTTFHCQSPPEWTPEKLQRRLFLFDAFASCQGVRKLLVQQLKIFTQVTIMFFAENRHSSHVQNIFRKFRVIAQRIDRVSRVIFPTLYIFFVLSYFCRYIQPWSWSFFEEGGSTLQMLNSFSLRV